MIIIRGRPGFLQGVHLDTWAHPLARNMGIAFAGLPTGKQPLFPSPMFHFLSKYPDLQKLPVIAHEVSVNDLAQNVSNSTNHRAASVDSTRQLVKVGGSSVWESKIA